MYFLSLSPSLSFIIDSSSFIESSFETDINQTKFRVRNLLALGIIYTLHAGWSAYKNSWRDIQFIIDKGAHSDAGSNAFRNFRA